MKEESKLCLCHSQKPYSDCCHPFHEGALPKTALELMRSRFSAYALNLAEYIIRTTHPANPEYGQDHCLWAGKITEFSRHTEFRHLEILEANEWGTVATVTYVAYLVQGGREEVFTEKSYFQKMGEKWFYRSGRLAAGRALDLMTHGRTPVLPLAYYGDPILRQQASPVERIDEGIRKLVEEMIETMSVCNGVGLAAPQVHRSLQIFLIRVPREVDDGMVDWGEVKVLINPILSSPSKESWKAPEGCLSIPLVRADVERPCEVTVEYTDLNGQQIVERCAGWQAKAIFHENDHIDGVLFIDRLEKEEREKWKPILGSVFKRF
jgi:peptide deformylase